MIKYAQNMDNCPKWDAILTKDMCNGCSFYEGFTLENGIPCIKCCYFDQFKTLSEGQNN